MDTLCGLYLYGFLIFTVVSLSSDCPQVQCVEQYVAQQADELTLEPTEIINVVRKTNEGKTWQETNVPTCG